jgi:hypothetical protein
LPGFFFDRLSKAYLPEPYSDMSQSLFLIGQLITLLLTAGLLGSLYTALRIGMSRLKQPPAQRKKAGRLVILSLSIWLLISIGLASSARYGTAEPVLTMLSLFLLPSVFFLLLLGFRFFRQVILITPPQWIVKVQGIRIALSLLLWMGYAGRYVPPQLTFLWFNYDIVVGISALMGSYVFFARGQFRRPETLLWNTFGLFSLLYLVAIALVSLPQSPYQLFVTTPDGAFLTQPLFVPLMSFIFPFCMAMHVYSIWQALRRPARRTFRLHK